MQNLREEKNVKILAVPGAGKTTSILKIAEEQSDVKMLLLTYNNNMRNDTKKKSTHLKNLIVHTFHSFCGEYFGRGKSCTDD